MRHDVHAAALGAASRVAFSILLAGCAGATTTTEAPLDSSSTQSDEAELRRKKACHEPDAAPAKPACDQVLASAFPDPNAWAGGGEDAGADVKTCCVELLQSEKDPGIDRPPYHWSCCRATQWGAEADAGIACTPWGPPVPPAMIAVGVA